MILVDDDDLKKAKSEISKMIKLENHYLIKLIDFNILDIQELS